MTDAGWQRMFLIPLFITAGLLLFKGTWSTEIWAEAATEQQLCAIALLRPRWMLRGYRALVLLTLPSCLAGFCMVHQYPALPVLCLPYSIGSLGVHLLLLCIQWRLYPFFSPALSCCCCFPGGCGDCDSVMGTYFRPRVLWRMGIVHAGGVAQILVAECMMAVFFSDLSVAIANPVTKSATWLWLGSVALATVGHWMGTSACWWPHRQISSVVRRVCSTCREPLVYWPPVPNSWYAEASDCEWPQSRIRSGPLRTDWPTVRTVAQPLTVPSPCCTTSCLTWDLMETGHLELPRDIVRLVTTWGLDDVSPSTLPVS